MKIILSHPTGNANVRAVAEGMAKAGMLHRFYTAIAAFRGNLWYWLGGLHPLAEFRRRSFSALLQAYTYQYPWFDLGRQVVIKLGLRSLVAHETGFFCIDKVYQSLDKQVAKALSNSNSNKPTAVYAYEDGALTTFERAKQLGITTLYDLPIGYWRAARTLLKAEQDSRPEWASTLTGFNDSEQKLARKDSELALADRIFVASSFTARTLKEYSAKLAPVSIIPYGFPPVNEKNAYTFDGLRPLRILFVGGLSQRKGIANVFEAVAALKHKVTLTVIGQKSVPHCEALNEALKLHNWLPSMPHKEVLQQMQEHDLLVFPSLFEGFGLVITEAMSQGTPVITTDRTAGPDLIQHGLNGWLVEAGNTNALLAQIEELINNPNQIEKAGRAAIETAQKRPWSVYSEELCNELNKTMNEITLL